MNASELHGGPRFATNMWIIKISLMLTASLCACGGSQGGSPNWTTTSIDVKRTVSLEIPVAKIKTLVFEPLAPIRPGMLLADPKDRKLTLEEEKQIYQKQTDLVVKQARAIIVVTMLYRESQKQPEPARRQLREEARAILREVQLLAKDKTDELIIRVLGSYEIDLQDWPAAEKAWSTLVVNNSSSELTLYDKAWWGYALLKQDKNAAALDLLKGDTVGEKEPEHAYVTAWAKWRMHDDAGARTAIAAAYADWGPPAYLRDQVWPTVVQLLADEHVEVTQRNLDSGYLMFELREHDKTFRGTLNVTLMERDGQRLVRFVLQTDDQSNSSTLAMLEQLKTKLRAKLGSVESSSPDA